jgi:hypothetical protein
MTFFSTAIVIKMTQVTLPVTLVSFCRPARLMRLQRPCKKAFKSKIADIISKSTKTVFWGSEASYLVKLGYAADRETAVELGRELAYKCNLFEHVECNHELKDERLFYKKFNTPKHESNKMLDVKALRSLAKNRKGGQSESQPLSSRLV